MYNFLIARMQKGFLPLYRLAAVLTLYGVLICVFAYASLMGFYSVNTSWVAPTVLHSSDDKSLDLTSKLLASQNTAEALALDVKKQNASIIEMEHHLADLKSLRPEIDQAIQREGIHNNITGKELDGLAFEKQADNLRTEALLRTIAELDAGIAHDLRMGLITKSEAATARTQLNSQRNLSTDGRIGSVLLKDTLLEKNTLNTSLLDIRDKRIELESQISQLIFEIQLAKTQTAQEQIEVDRLADAINTAMQTPYYTAISSNAEVNFAFVPYDNAGSIKSGASVYDCYLSFVGCRYVGSVSRVFSNEEDTLNPIYRSPMRGFLVQLTLTRPESAKSKTLFVGHKPLLF